MYEKNAAICVLPSPRQPRGWIPCLFLVEEKKGGHGDQDKGQGRGEALAVVGVGRRIRRLVGAGGRGAGRGAAGVGGAAARRARGSASARARAAARGGARGRGAAASASHGRSAGGRAAREGPGTDIRELRAVVVLTGRVGNPDGVLARGEILERKGVLAARLAGDEVGDHLQVVGVIAGHEGDGDRARGTAPLEGKRRVLLDLVVRVEENGLCERSGREGEDGTKGELHCERK